MRVLAPVSITPAMLVSSSIPETDHPVWSAATTYGLAARIIYERRIYESLQAGNLNKIPGAPTSVTWWLDVGPTKRWAMFDDIVDTISTASGSIAVTLAMGVVCNSVAVIAGIGNEVRVRMLDGVTVVYDQTKTLDSTSIDDWDDYFFATQVLAGELLFSGLPRYLAASIEVTLTGTGMVSIGVLAIGTLHELGAVERGASAGITDYSRKEADEFGATSLVQRSFARRSTQRLLVPIRDMRRIQDLLARLRATPCVWIGANDTTLYSPLVIFGWFRDFQLDIEFIDFCFCSLEIEGLT